MVGSKYISPLSPRYLLHLSDILFLSFCRRRREERSLVGLMHSASILSSDAFWIVINALLQICSSLLSFASTYATADILGAVVEGDSRAAVHGLCVSLACYSALGICLAMTARLGEELRVSMRYNLTRYLHALYFQPRVAYWCSQGLGPGCAAADGSTAGTGTGKPPSYAYPFDSVDQRLTQDVDSLSRQLCLVLFGGYTNMYAGLAGSLASLLITVTAITALSALPAGIGLAFALLMTAALAALAERVSRAYYASDKGMGMLRSHFARQAEDALQVTLLQGRNAEEAKGNGLLQAYYSATLRYYGISALQAVVSGFAAGYPYVLSLGCCLVVVQVLGPSALSTFLDAAGDGAGESDDPSGVDPIALSTASAIIASYISALTALPSLWASFGALGGALGRVYELLQALRLIHGGTDAVACSTLNWRPVNRRGTAVGDRVSRLFSTVLVQPLFAVARWVSTGTGSASTAQEEEDGEGSGDTLLSLLTEESQHASHGSGSSGPRPGLGVHPPTAPLPIGSMEVADAIRTWVAALPATVQDRDSTGEGMLAPLLIVQAPSGTGKSSAVRVLSGLWPVPPEDVGWQWVVRACLGGRTALFIPQTGSDSESEAEEALSVGSSSGDLCPSMEVLPSALASLSHTHGLDVQDQGALQQALRTYGAVAQSRCIPVGVSWLSLSALVGAMIECARGLLASMRDWAAWLAMMRPAGGGGQGRRAAAYAQLSTMTSDSMTATSHSSDSLPVSVRRVLARVAQGGEGETAVRGDGKGPSGHAGRPCGTAVFLDEPFPTLYPAAQAAAIAALRRAVRHSPTDAPGPVPMPSPGYVVLLTTDAQAEQTAALDGSQEGVTVVRLGGFCSSASTAAVGEGQSEASSGPRMQQLLQGILPEGTVRVCSVAATQASTPAQAPSLTTPASTSQQAEAEVAGQEQAHGRPAAFDAVFRARLLRILSVLSPYWTPPSPGPMTSPALLAAVTCASIAGCIGLALITVVVSAAPGLIVTAILAGDDTAAWAALARATGLYLLSPCLGALTRFLGRHLSLLLYARLVQEGSKGLCRVPLTPPSATQGGGGGNNRGQGLDRIDQRLVADSLSLANSLGVLCFGGDGRLPLLQVLATIIATSASIMSRGHSGWALACVFTYALTGIMLNKAALSPIPAALALVSAAESMLRATHVRVRSACEAVALQGTERAQGRAAEASLTAVSVSALNSISAEFSAKLINALVANISTVAAYGFGALLCFNSAAETASNAYTLTFLLMSLLMYVAALPDYATAAAEVAGYTARVGVLFEALGVARPLIVGVGTGEQEAAAAGHRQAAQVAWGQEEVTIRMPGKADAVRVPLPRVPGEVLLCQGLGEAEEAETALLLALALSQTPEAKGRGDSPAASGSSRQVVLLPREPYVPSPPCSLLAAVLYPGLPARAGAGEEEESAVLAVLRACGLDAACRAAAGKVRGHRSEAGEDDGRAAFLRSTEIDWRAVLSRGERSRLALARALFSLRSITGTDSASQTLAVPTVLCASDPFQGLDPAAAAQCAQAVRAQGVGIVVLLSS